MKRFFTDKTVRVLICLCVFVLGMFAVSAIGELLTSAQTGEAFAGEGPDMYEIRSRLLMQATDATGACSPEKAAQIWAEGLKQRSAALQYAVMAKALKDEYARQLGNTFPNWVTGVSSPWIEQYNLVKKEQIDNNTYRFLIRFATATSSGPAGSYDARLTIAAQGDYWRVSMVEEDEGLKVYTGFE
jgi:hypothetical protein